MNETTKPSRKRRSDAGKTLWTDRDITALTWMAHHSAMRIDHLQVLLGQLVNRPMSLGATCSVMAQWRNAGWVEAQKVLTCEPMWIWPTRSALRQLDLPYRYEDIEQSSVGFLKHLAVINEIRLRECTISSVWVSQRQLLQEVKRGRVLPNLPDAEMHQRDGKRIAIKVELCLQEIPALTEFLMGLMRGEGEPYSEVWYVAPLPEVRKQIRQTCTQMLSWSDLAEKYQAIS